MKNLNILIGPFRESPLGKIIEEYDSFMYDTSGYSLKNEIHEEMYQADMLFFSNLLGYKLTAEIEPDIITQPPKREQELWNYDTYNNR